MKKLLLIVLISLFFLPSVLHAQTSAAPHIFVPYYPSYPSPWIESTIFWYGKINNSDNYTDIRTLYNDDHLLVIAHVFDGQMWYDTTPQAVDMDRWDSVSLFISNGEVLYKFTAQVNNWEDESRYKSAWLWDGSAWDQSVIPFTIGNEWRGSSPNSNSTNESGWSVRFYIPFSSINQGTIPHGEDWQIGLITHDRDDSVSTAYQETRWPASFVDTDPTTGGTFTFGLPTPPVVQVSNATTTLIREDATHIVPDGVVGGNTNCGGGLDRWTQWGDKNYVSIVQFGIQNQNDVADWPCFSKYFVTFPITDIPPGKAIQSATLRLHQFGNSGGGTYPDGFPSNIHVATVDKPWDETTLTWNNAPQVLKTISSTWVDIMREPLVHPGVPHEWDVTTAVRDAYQNGGEVRLGLYSSDMDYHSGKYFTSSEAGDWNIAARPALEITWGNVAAVSPTPTTTAPKPGDADSDGDVDIFDYNAVLSNFGVVTGASRSGGDLDGDGDVDIFDYNEVIGNFGR